jgi:hypothetical protein
MKVIYTGKKPNPQWVGPWECSVCHTVVELESKEELMNIVVSDAEGGTGKAIECPLCERAQRVYRHVPNLEGDPSAIQDRINEDNEWARRQALVLDAFREERDLQ